MKRCIFFISIILIEILLAGCRKPDPSQTPTLTALITVGEWRISLMKDRNVFYTNEYNGWRFSFASDSTVTATNGITTYSGTWSEDPVRKRFSLNIPAADFRFLRINGQWEIAYKTSRRLDFKDDIVSTTKELQITRL